LFDKKSFRGEFLAEISLGIPEMFAVSSETENEKNVA